MGIASCTRDTNALRCLNPTEVARCVQSLLRAGLARRVAVAQPQTAEACLGRDSRRDSEAVSYGCDPRRVRCSENFGGCCTPAAS
jgi:hypothetical protein